MSNISVDILLQAKDNVSSAVKTATSSLGGFGTATKMVQTSSKDMALALNAVGTSAFALYGIYDRVSDSAVSVSRANLQVQSTLNSLEDAQRRYNQALQSGSPERITAALSDLNLAQERYNVAVERSEMVSGNFNEILASSAMMVIPSMITMVTSLHTAMGLLSGATGVLSGALAFLAANPIILVGIGIAALVTALVFLSAQSNQTAEDVERDFQKQVDAVNQSYDEQMRATDVFYDNLIAAAREALDNVRSARTEDMNNLELNFLLQKQTLKTMHEEGKISTEEYNAKLKEIEDRYYTERSALSDEWRIKELQSEEKFSEDSTNIDAERNSKKLGLEEKHIQDMIDLETEKQAKINEIQIRELAKQEETLKLSQGRQTADTQQYLEDMLGKHAAFEYEMVGASVWLDLCDRMSSAWGGMTGGVTIDFGTMADTITAVYNATLKPVFDFLGSLQGQAYATAEAIRAVPAWTPPEPAEGMSTGGYLQPYQHGGWVTRPTVALLGETEPELVIPESRLISGGAGNYFDIDVNIAGSADERTAQLAAELVMKRVRSLVAS